MSSRSDRGDFGGLEVLVDDQDRVRTIQPCGEIDMATAPLVRSPLSEAFDDGFQTVVLDLSQTTFIDSSGIAVALYAFQRATNSSIEFRVVPGPEQVHRTFVISGLVDHLPFADRQNASAGKVV